MCSNSDFDQDGVRDQSHPKLYFGKWKHAAYPDPRLSDKTFYLAWTDDFRNDDYYFLAYNNLRNAADPSVLNRKCPCSSKLLLVMYSDS